MKTLMAVACVLLLSAAPAFAAPRPGAPDGVAVNGHASQDALARMGLGEMTSLSDAEGKTIRGTPLTCNGFFVPGMAPFSVPAFSTRFIFPWQPRPVFSLPY